MAKYKNYDYSQMVMLPISLEDQLMPGTLEFAIHTLVETRMDLSRFDDRYANDETGRSAYDPKILLKIVLFGYSRGMISSRRIERACQENVTFMALSCGQCPDHSTIAAFVSSMKDEIMPLFRDVLLVCEEMDLLGGTFFALDGLRLPSNASKQWSGTRSELERKKKRIESRVKELLCEHTEEDKRDEGSPKAGASTGGPDRQRQIERLQKKADRIGRWLEQNGAKVGAKGKEITSNITDNESAKMKAAGGYIQGYNGQALVDSKHQVIIHGEALGESQDYEHVPPMVEGAKQNMEAIGHSEDYFRGAILTADTNYHSRTNIQKCEQEGLDAYIPDRFFRRRDPRYKSQRRYWPKRKKRFGLEAFYYDESTDRYVCPAGNYLKLKVRRVKNTGNFYRQYSADETDCGGCTLRSRCLGTKSSRRRWLNVPNGTEGKNYSKQMVEKIDSERGRQIYP
ncbi:MAG: transposase, partial [Proteobacteria bacterium]|nr:transposase [Pseudomonadota bacterium]